ncbi:MAG: hypothetical protein LQ339_001489 [Xanthoria mediterranea]|nr:MAG: hypothetical protein LQ339_001489 [Xanthoria mediterranea]
MQPSKLLLALVAIIPFSAAAEADLSNENTNTISARAPPYWIAQFYEGTTCSQSGISSYDTWDQPYPCHNIQLLNNITPGSFKFTSGGVWKLRLFNRVDCQGEVLVQGAGTQPVCQKAAGIWPKRSFKVVRA